MIEYMCNNEKNEIKYHENHQIKKIEKIIKSQNHKIKPIIIIKIDYGIITINNIVIPSVVTPDF